MAAGTYTGIWKTAALIGGGIAVYFVVYEAFFVPQALKDVTSDSQYSSVLGKRFSVKEDLLALGITLDRNYRKQVDYVTLVPLPGFSGPEVVTKQEVKKGTQLRVVGVLRSNAGTNYKVEVISDQEPTAAPLVVRQSGAIDDGNFGIDRKIYGLLN